MLTAHDAALVIGDPALQIDAHAILRLISPKNGFATPASLSSSLSGRSSAGVARNGSSQDLAAVFQQSRDTDLNCGSRPNHREWGPRLGLKEADVRSYLTESIYYHWMQRALKAYNSSIAMRLKSEPCPPLQNYFSRRKSLYSVIESLACKLFKPEWLSI